ncbi:MAG: hypothetical protein HN505_10430 [Verrucomicrobia bacterium]|jgi:hypothetical protein|nr:hypothetical protein [Verrucomicrobiota bacterium]
MKVILCIFLFLFALSTSVANQPNFIIYIMYDVPNKIIPNVRQDPYKKKFKNHHRSDQPGVFSGSLSNNHP